MKKTVILLIGLLYLLCLNCASAEESSTMHYGNFDKQTETPVISRGDRLLFTVYITGFGNITNPAKLFISLPPHLVNSSAEF